jgi:hypothetical protein
MQEAGNLGNHNSTAEAPWQVAATFAHLGSLGAQLSEENWYIRPISVETQESIHAVIHPTLACTPYHVACKPCCAVPAP